MADKDIQAQQVEGQKAQEQNVPDGTTQQPVSEEQLAAKTNKEEQSMISNQQAVSANGSVQYNPPKEDIPPDTDITAATKINSSKGKADAFLAIYQENMNVADLHQGILRGWDIVLDPIDEYKKKFPNLPEEDLKKLYSRAQTINNLAHSLTTQQIGYDNNYMPVGLAMSGPSWESVPDYMIRREDKSTLPPLSVGGFRADLGTTLVISPSMYATSMNFWKDKDGKIHESKPIVDRQDGYYEVVKGNTQKGEPEYYLQLRDKDTWIDPTKILDTWGPQRLFSPSMLSTSVRAFEQGAALPVQGLAWIMESANTLAGGSEDNALGRTVNKLHNYLGAHTHQDLDEMESFGSNWSSTTWQVVNGIGQMATTFGFSYAAAAPMTALLGERLAATVVEWTGLIANSAGAGDMTNQQLRAYGFNREEALAGSFLIAMGALASENVFGLNTVYRSAFMNKEVVTNKILNGAVKDEMERVVGAFTNKEVKREAVKWYTRQGLVNAWRSVRKLGEKSPYYAAILSPIEEGAEEVIEGAFDYPVNEWLNKRLQEDAMLTKSKYSHYKFEKTDKTAIKAMSSDGSVKMVMDPKGVYKVTDPYGRSYYITFAQYQRIQNGLKNADMIIKGDVDFNAGSNLDQGLAAFFSTIPFGIFHAVRGGSKANTISQRNAFYAQAYANLKSPSNRKVFTSMVDSWVRSGSGILKTVDENGNQVDDITKSVAYSMGQNIKEQVDLYESIMKDNDGALLNEEMENILFDNGNIFKHGIDALTENVQLKQALNNYKDGEEITVNEKTYKNRKEIEDAIVSNEKSADYYLGEKELDENGNWTGKRKGSENSKYSNAFREQYLVHNLILKAFKNGDPMMLDPSERIDWINNFRTSLATVQYNDAVEEELKKSTQPLESLKDILGKFDEESLSKGVEGKTKEELLTNFSMKLSEVFGQIGDLVNNINQEQERAKSENTFFSSADTKAIANKFDVISQRLNNLVESFAEKFTGGDMMQSILLTEGLKGGDISGIAGQFAEHKGQLGDIAGMFGKVSNVVGKNIEAAKTANKTPEINIGTIFRDNNDLYLVKKINGNKVTLTNNKGEEKVISKEKADELYGKHVENKKTRQSNIDGIFFGEFLKTMEEMSVTPIQNLKDPEKIMRFASMLNLIPVLKARIKTLRELNRVDEDKHQLMDNHGPEDETLTHAKEVMTAKVNGKEIKFSGNKVSKEEIDHLETLLHDIEEGQNGFRNIQALKQELDVNDAMLEFADAKKRMKKVQREAEMIELLFSFLDDGSVNKSFNIWDAATVKNIQANLKEIRERLDRLNALEVDDEVRNSIIEAEKELNSIKQDLHNRVREDNKKGRLWREVTLENIRDQLSRYVASAPNEDNLAPHVVHFSTVSEEAEINIDDWINGRYELMDNNGNPVIVGLNLTNIQDIGSRLANIDQKSRAGLANLLALRYYNFTNEIFLLDQEEFFTKYHESVKDFKLENGEYMPTIAQEDAIKMAYMMYSAKKQGEKYYGLFSEVTGYEERTDEDKARYRRRLVELGLHTEEEFQKNDDGHGYKPSKLINWTNDLFPFPLMDGVIVQGTGGAGKTTLIMPIFTRMIQDDDLKYIVIGVDQGNIETLIEKSSIDKKKVHQKMTLQEYLNSEKENIPDGKYVVIVDEASLLPSTAVYHKIFGKIKKSDDPNYGKRDGASIFTNENGFTLFLLDPQQPTPDFDQTNNNYTPVLNLVPRAAYIPESYRTDVSSISNLQRVVSQSMTSWEKPIELPIRSEYNKNSTKGIKFNKSIKDVILDWEADIKKYGPDGRYLIFPTKQDAVAYMNTSRVDKDILNNHVKWIVSNDNSETAQGKEYKYVYAAVSVPDGLGMKRILKTIWGRAQKFLNIVNNNPDATSVISDNIYDESELPEEEKAKILAQKEKSFLHAKDRVAKLADFKKFSGPQDTEETTTTEHEQNVRRRAEKMKSGVEKVIEKLKHPSTDVIRFAEKDFLDEMVSTLQKRIKSFYGANNSVKIENAEKGLKSTLNSLLNLALKMIENAQRLTPSHVLGFNAFIAIKSQKADLSDEIREQIEEQMLLFVDSVLKEDKFDLSVIEQIVSNNTVTQEEKEEEIAIDKDNITDDFTEEEKGLLKQQGFILNLTEAGTLVPVFVESVIKRTKNGSVTTTVKVRYYNGEDTIELPLSQVKSMLQQDTIIHAIVNDFSLDNSSVSKMGIAIKKSAENYEKTGTLPVSLAFVPEDVYDPNLSSDENITNGLKRINELLKRYQEIDFSLVYHRRMKVYNAQVNDFVEVYDVITVETPKGDVIGTLYQPYGTEQEIKNVVNHGSISLVENKGSYYEPKNGDNAYTEKLRSLYKQGKDSGLDRKEVGTVAAQNITTTGLVFSKQEVSLGQLLQNIFKGEGYAVGKNGNVISNSKDIVIFQIAKEGRITHYIKAGRLDGMGSEVAIEVKGPKLTQEDVRRINSEAKSLLDRINETNDQEKLKTIAKDFYFSEAYQTLLYNRSFFLDDGKVIDKYNNILTVNEQGYLEPAKTKGQMSFRKQLRQQIENVAAIISKEQDNLYYNLSKSGKEIVVNDDILEHVTSDVSKLNAPHLLVKEINSNEEQDIKNPFSNVGSLKEDKGEIERESTQSQTQYLRSIFGNDFIDNNLKFKRHISFNGKNAFGLTQKFLMILKEENGQVLQGIGRHEAVHFALMHFVSPESRSAILSDVKGYMIQIGYAQGEITDKDAEEFLAEFNRGVLQKPKKTSIFVRFANWLKRVISRLLGNSESFKSFLTDLNAGKFKDQTFSYAQDIANSDVRLLEEGKVYDNFEDFADEILPDDKYYTTTELTKIMGGQPEYSLMEVFIRREFLKASPAIRPLAQEGPMTIPEITAYIINFLPQVNAYWKSQGMNIKNADGNYKKLGELNTTQEKLFLLTSKVYEDNSFTSNKIIESFIQKIAPDYSFDDDHVDLMSTHIFDKINSKDFTATTSTILKAYLSSINYSVWSLDENGRLKREKNIAPIHYQKLHSVLMEAGREAYLNSFKGKELVSNMFDILFERAKNQIGTEEANIILSFLDSFSNKAYGVVSENGRMRFVDFDLLHEDIEKRQLNPFRIVMNKDELLEAAKRMGKEDEFMQRLSFASDFVNAFATTYFQLEKLTSLQVQHSFKDSSFVPVVKFSTDKELIKSEMMENFKKTVFDGLGYSKKFYDKVIAKNPYKVIVDKTGITLKGITSNTRVISFQYGKGNVPEFSFTTDANSMNVYSLFNLLGIRVDHRAINIIFNSTEGALGITKEDLATILGDLYFSSKGFAIKDNEFYKEWYNRTRKKYSGLRHISFMEEMGLEKFPTVEEVQKMDIEDEEKETFIERVQRQSTIEGNPNSLTFFDHFKKLAVLNVTMQRLSSKNMVWTPEGGKMFGYVIPTTIDRVFVNNDNFDADAPVRIMADDKNENSTLFITENGEIKPVGALFSGKMTIHSISPFQGLRGEFLGHDVNHLTDDEYVNSILFGYYYKSLTKPVKYQRLMVPITNFSDSQTFPMANVTLSEGPGKEMVQVVRDGKQVYFRVNDKLVNELLMEEFKAEARNTEKALEGWLGYKVTTGEEKDGFFTLTEEEKKEISSKKKLSHKIEAAIDILKKKSKSLAAERDILQELSRHGLVEGEDFVVDPNKAGVDRVRLVKRSLMNNDDADANPFNAVGFKLFEDFYGTEDAAVIRDAIFESLLHEAYKPVSDLGIEEPNGVSSWEHGNKKFIRIDRPGLLTRIKRDYNGVAVKDFLKDFNPFYKGFAYAKLITERNVLRQAVANDTQFKDPQTKSKYVKSGVTQGHISFSDEVNPFRLPKRQLVLHIAEEKKESKEGKYSVSDGLIWTNRIFTHLMFKSLGGRISVMGQNDNTIKTVTSGVDRETGEGRFIKSSTMNLTNDMYRYNPERFNKIMFLMLDGHRSLTEGQQKIKDNGGDVLSYNMYALYKHYLSQSNNPTEALQRVTDYIVEIRTKTGIDLTENILMKVIDDSTVKIKTAGKNYYTFSEIMDNLDPDNPEFSNKLIYTTINSDQEAWILNANQDTSKAEVNDINQIKFLSGIDSIAGDKIDTIDSLLTERLSEEIKKDFLNSKSVEEVNAKLRKFGISLADNVSYGAELNELLSNDDITMQLPQLFNMIWPVLAKKISRTINLKVPGLKMVQYPSEQFFHLDEVIVKHGSGTVKMRLSKYDQQFYDVVGVEKSRTDLLPMRKEGMGIKPAEVIVPFVYKEQFGVVGTPSLNEMLRVVDDKGNVYNLRTLVELKYGDVYSPEQAAEVIDEYFSKHKVGEGSFIITGLSEEVTKALTEKGVFKAEKVAQWYKSLFAVLDTFSARIPSSTKGFAFAGKVVDFTYDSGNVIFRNSEQSLRDDSDYDIDQLTTLFRGITIKNGIPVVSTANEEKVLNTGKGGTDIGLKNLKFDILYNEWLKAENWNYVSSQLDMDKVKKRAESNGKKENFTYNGFESNMKFHTAAHTGKNMTGVVSNIMHAYSRLERLAHNPKLLDRIVKNPELKQALQGKQEDIVKVIGTVFQMAVDNRKLMYLGVLGINESTGSLIAALALSGKSMDEIIDYLEKDVVKNTLQKVSKGRSIYNKSYDAYTELENQKNDLVHTEDDEEYWRDAKEEDMKRAHTTAEHSAKDLSVLYSLTRIKTGKGEIEDYNLLNETRIDDIYNLIGYNYKQAMLTFDAEEAYKKIEKDIEMKGCK